MRTIFHLDLDSFFVSVERILDPSLNNKPVIVGADPDFGRGVVAACSYEAREYGVHSGMPINEALQLCPHLTMVRGSFKLYGEVSKRIMKILEHYSPVMKVAGNDEAYLDLTDVVADYEEAKRLATELKDDIYASESKKCFP